MTAHISFRAAPQPTRLLALASMAMLVGCDQKDPGVQAELIQLKAERTQLNSRVQELESSIQSKNDEINTLRSRASDNTNVESFDKQASMNRFISKVAELKAEIQSEFPDAQLSDSVQMPAFDAPLQSEVRIDVRRAGQTTRSFRWVGRGKLTGDWEFSQRQEGAAPTTSGGNPIAENTNSGTGTNTDIGTDADPGTNSGTSPNTGTNTGTGTTDGVVGKKDPEPPPIEPSDIPPGSRLVREDAQGKVWLTPDGRYIIKLNQ